MKLPLYLDCNGSTPCEPAVLRQFQTYISDPQYWGNCSAGHARRGRKALQEAREYLAGWAGIPMERSTGVENSVFFCASATEANNMAILGLLAQGLDTGKKHIIASELEHASVLQPCEYLLRHHGFELSLAPVESSGQINIAGAMRELRPETLLICCMQVNNETGIIQPVAELAETLLRNGHDAYLHVDASQGAAHIDSSIYPQATVQHPRIDMISISGHKIYGLCGIAALLLKPRHSPRRIQRQNSFPPLQALWHGGGQQGQGQLKGLRPGSLPLALALSLRDALELCESQRTMRRARNQEFRKQFLQLLAPLQPQLHGDPDKTLAHVANLSLPGIDAESALLNLRQLLVAGRGAACSQDDKSGSRVLAAMGINPERQRNALRFSWWHHSPQFWNSDSVVPKAQTIGEANWAQTLLQKLQRLQV